MWMYKLGQEIDETGQFRFNAGKRMAQIVIFFFLLITIPVAIVLFYYYVHRLASNIQMLQKRLNISPQLNVGPVFAITFLPLIGFFVYQAMTQAAANRLWQKVPPGMAVLPAARAKAAPRAPAQGLAAAIRQPPHPGAPGPAEGGWTVAAHAPQALPGAPPAPARGAPRPEAHPPTRAASPPTPAVPGPYPPFPPAAAPAVPPASAAAPPGSVEQLLECPQCSNQIRILVAPGVPTMATCNRCGFSAPFG